VSTNQKFKFGAPINMSLACSDPATPASNGPVRAGQLTGVAETTEDADGNCTVNLGFGAYALSVKAVDDSGNSAVAVLDSIFYVDADTPKLSKKASGYFFGIALAIVTSGSTATITVLHVPSPGSGALGSGTVGTTNLATAAVTAGKLSSTLKTGFIPLDINTCRILATNAVQNTTEGGVPDGNTDPVLARKNGATDIALQLKWAAASVVEVQFNPVALPPDVDEASTLTVNLLVSKDTNTDNAAVVALKIFQGIGGSNVGGNTAALATAAITKYTVTVSAVNLAGPPSMLNIAIVPGTHAADAIFLNAAWIEYTRA
jgi:hypothetical protein